MGNRRGFLKWSAAVAATPLLAKTGGATVLPAGLPISSALPEVLARDEAHWRAVRALYPVQDEIINLEHGYWGKMSRSVEEAYLRHTRRVNQDLSWYARRDYERDFLAARASVAEALGVKLNELMLTRNATESFVNLITQFQGLKPGDEILWADADYPEFKKMMAWLAETRQVSGHTIKLPASGSDEDYLQVYRQAIEAQPKLKLMLLTHVSNQHGLTLPVRKIAALAKKRGIHVICDCAQSWGLLDFRLDDLGVDWAVFNLHKWIGSPVGVGALYMREGTLGAVQPFPGAAASDADVSSRVHMATANFAAFLTVPEALAFHQAIGGANKEARLRYLRESWVEPLGDIEGVEILGAASAENATGMGGLRLRGRTSKADAEELQSRLQHQFGVFTVVRDGLASGACVRVTPQVFSSVREVEVFVEAVEEIAATS
ncbi:MAG: aminotransferase class V-fold PLP-dependent enzyme [Xanthomonadales bacterium]|nr:aminotransferase class V-fold PLP-dependent enzyme [Xanthomonadales bacterium]